MTQITYAIPSSTTHAYIARPLNITFLLLALSSLYLMGFESSLINFTCPHFCPQLFIGPYYENLNLLFDYWLLPLEASGFWCIIEYSWSHKWLLHTRIKVLAFWMSNHLAEETPPPPPTISQWSLYSPRETSSPVILQSSWCTVWRKNLKLTLQCCSSAFLGLSMVTLSTGSFY